MNLPADSGRTTDSEVRSPSARPSPPGEGEPSAGSGVQGARFSIRRVLSGLELICWAGRSRAMPFADESHPVRGGTPSPSARDRLSLQISRPRINSCRGASQTWAECGNPFGIGLGRGHEQHRL